MAKTFKGLGTALVTPFKKDGSIDWSALEWLIKYQIANGANFLVPCGTTGESPTLSQEEHIRVIRFTVEISIEASGKRVLILAGTGSNNTAEAVELTRTAKAAGADGALVVSPYYNKPTPRGLVDYYEQVAAVGLPVILYDIPGRTARGVPTDIILHLASERIIQGIKWASGDTGQLKEIIRKRPEHFTVLSGDDNLTFYLMSLGGDGVVSVVSNLVPQTMFNLIEAMKRSTQTEARRIHDKLLPLMKAMFIETNPIPVKAALAIFLSSIFTPTVRSPMYKMEERNEEELRKILKDYDLV